MAIEKVELDPELKKIDDIIKNTNPSTLTSLKDTNETQLSTLESKISTCLESLTSAGTWNDSISDKLKTSAATITDLISKCKSPAGDVLTAVAGAVTSLQSALKDYIEAVEKVNEMIDTYNSKEANPPKQYNSKENDDGTTTNTVNPEYTKWQQELEDMKSVIMLKKDEIENYKATCDSLIAQIKGLLSPIDSEASTAALGMSFNITKSLKLKASDIDKTFDDENYVVEGTETVDKDGKIVSRTYTVYDKNGKVIQTGTIKYDADGKEIDRVSKDYTKSGKGADVDFSKGPVDVTGDDGKKYKAEQQSDGKIVIKDDKGNVVEVLSQEDFNKKYKPDESKKDEDKKEEDKKEEDKKEEDKKEEDKKEEDKKDDDKEDENKEDENKEDEEKEEDTRPAIDYENDPRFQRPKVVTREQAKEELDKKNPVYVYGSDGKRYKIVLEGEYYNVYDQNGEFKTSSDRVDTLFNRYYLNSEDTVKRYNMGQHNGFEDDSGQYDIVKRDGSPVHNGASSEISTPQSFDELKEAFKNGQPIKLTSGQFTYDYDGWGNNKYNASEEIPVLLVCCSDGKYRQVYADGTLVNDESVYIDPQRVYDSPATDYNQGYAYNNTYWTP